ncbi:hypothetical protein M3084_08570 [Succinatimonas hippei]|uniref:hypothetical protein n=1 Tax=Succinatimonas hippei TaxID=626938 RepID=UPI0020135481|nr:hypothetical protein [Succinatimonas hippei]MCL1603900.1 hypothetical protein [Succinatimonas hippei]
MSAKKKSFINDDNPAMSFISDDSVKAVEEKDAAVKEEPKQEAADKEKDTVKQVVVTEEQKVSEPKEAKEEAKEKEEKTEQEKKEADVIGRPVINIVRLPKGMRVNSKYVETKSKRIQLTMQPSLYARVKKASEKAKISVNDYIHQVLDQVTE